MDRRNFQDLSESGISKQINIYSYKLWEENAKKLDKLVLENLFLICWFLLNSVQMNFWNRSVTSLNFATISVNVKRHYQVRFSLGVILITR